MAENFVGGDETGAASRPDRGRRAGSTAQGGHTVWLSVAQAAARASVSKRHLKRFIPGELPATRLPSPKGRGHLRIRLGDLEAFLARGLLK